MAEFNYVTGQYEGYDAYMAGPSPAVSAAQGADWVSNLGYVFGYAGKTAVDTWSAKSLMQTSQTGQRYIEGQRAQAVQGTISPLLLLGLAAVVFVALK